MPYMKAAALAAALAFFSTIPATLAAQHEGHAAQPAPDTLRAPTPTPSHGGHADTTAVTPRMSHSPLSIPMDRMGSGTTWIPEAAPVPSRHFMLGSWNVMAHGFVWAQYDIQGGPRGDDQLGSLNWGMLMASHELAGGQFEARMMLSVDPATVTGRGYPLLLQTGESYEGQPLRDRQHPHDFWMEVGALYQRPISQNLAWSLYVAPSGEPALGPVAFMHRPSAMDNPSAPLSHHWQDATHVSFGVLTAGLFSRTWQIEASRFNGREPDEHRWNFDPIRLDSWSGRVTFNPGVSWSFSAGAGHLESPEASHADESMQRYTASALHGRKVGNEGQSATAFVWGANRHGEAGDLTHSWLLENQSILDRRNTVFGRLELIQKSAAELGAGSELTDPLPGGDIHDATFNIAAAQLGYIREVARTRWATIGIGAAGTVNLVPKLLEETYGSRTPLGGFLFLRLRPFHLVANAMGGMNDHNH